MYFFHYMSLAYAVKESRLKGHSEGKLEGRLEGELAANLKTASEMKKLGLENSIIVQATGLPLFEIENL